MNKPFKKHTLYTSFIECKEENGSEDQWNFLKKAIMDSKEQYTCSALNFLTEEMGVKTIYINILH